MLENIFFGTYTKKISQGIYQATLNTDTKTISKPELLIAVNNPTYLTTTNNQLFTICKQDDHGGIASYSKDTTQLYTLNNKVLQDGAPPCYVSFDKQRNLVYAANYHTAEVLIYQLHPNNTLTLHQSISHSGSGPRPEQQSSHLHYADLTPDNRLVALDLGADQLLTYNFDNNQKALLNNVLTFPAGFGPRHLVFHPNQQIAYVVGELTSQVATLKYNPQNGRFSILDIQTTIPSEYHDFNGAAAIKISHNQQHLYISNRGFNSIACFKIESDASLQLIHQTTASIDFPRDFALDATDQFLVVANQNDNTISLFERNPAFGKLTLIQDNIQLPEGVCVKFVN